MLSYVHTGCFHTSTFSAHPGLILHQSSVHLDDLNAIFRTRVCTREPYPSPLKKGGLGYVQFMWTPVQCAAEVNTIVPNRRSEVLLMTYYFIKTHTKKHISSSIANLTAQLVLPNMFPNNQTSMRMPLCHRWNTTEVQAYNLHNK